MATSELRTLRPPTIASNLSDRAFQYSFPLPLVNEPEITKSIYESKRDLEYPEQFIKAVFHNFLTITRDKRLSNGFVLKYNDDWHIIYRIPEEELFSILTTNNFFVIDYDYLVKKFQLRTSELASRSRYSTTHRSKKSSRIDDVPTKTKVYKSASAAKSKLITDIISDHVLPSYEAYWVIRHCIDLIKSYLLSLSKSTSKKPVYRNRALFTEIPIPFTYTTPYGVLDFHDVWRNTKVGDDESRISEDERINPFMVLKYYIYELNKQVQYLFRIKITIVETLITTINKDLSDISNMMTEFFKVKTVGLPIQAITDSKLKFPNKFPVFSIRLPSLKTKSLTLSHNRTRSKSLNERRIKSV